MNEIAKMRRSREYQRVYQVLEARMRPDESPGLHQAVRTVGGVSTVSRCLSGAGTIIPPVGPTAVFVAALDYRRAKEGVVPD